MITSFGTHRLDTFKVITEEVNDTSAQIAA
jgi:hypothetical protein